MAGFMDMLLDKLHLNSEDEDDFYDFDDNEEVAESLPKKKAVKKTTPSEAIVPEPQKPVAKVKPSRSNNKVVPMRGSNLTSMEVCVIKPSNVDEDAREISDTLLSGRAVILNLEGIHVNIAQRIIDFTAGACYAINGNLKMVSNYIFIATPEAVDISGDFQELLGNVSSADQTASTIIRPNF